MQAARTHARGRAVVLLAPFLPFQAVHPGSGRFSRVDGVGVWGQHRQWPGPWYGFLERIPSLGFVPIEHRDVDTDGEDCDNGKGSGPFHAGTSSVGAVDCLHFG